MKRRGLVIAVAGGLVVAGGVALTREEARVNAKSAPAVAVVRDVRLVAGDAMRVEPGPGNRRGIAGTESIAVRAADPAGGPDWAVRTFQRPAALRKGRVWCSQLGRVVDGQFVWIQPGAVTAKRLPLAVTETTACALTAPISDHLGVQHAALPTQPARDPKARIATSLLWGVVDRPVTEAHVEHATLGGPVTLHGHAFLRVAKGPVAQPSYTRLVVTDLDGHHRAAATERFFQMGGLKLGVASGEYDRRPPRAIPVPKEKPFQLAARVDPADDGPPQGIFARVGASGGSCATNAVPIVGDRAISVFGRYSGLVVQLPMACNPLPEWADWIPVVIGAGWQSGYEEHAGGAANAARAERRNQERLEDTSGGITIGTPPGTKLLEVTSPVGVKVVRVTPGRVTSISWRGQPEVRDALFPQSRRLSGGRVRVDGPVVTFKALDSAGHQIGELGSTDANATWEARKRHREAQKRAASVAGGSAPLHP